MIPRETREHMERVGSYSEKIFRYLYAEQPEMIEEEFGENFLAYSEEVFRYHDIGRFFIPISVLNKVEKLTDEEFQLIKNHTVNAIPAIESIYKKPFPADVMKQLVNIAVYHHERWDGGGYPEGRKEKEIPLGARICAIADTYDGITAWKPYKKKQTTMDEAVLIITKESGKQFEPHLVDVFRSCMVDI
jgi:putative two-component system response regulator